MKKRSVRGFSFGPIEAGIVSVALIVTAFIGYQFKDINQTHNDTVANAEFDVVPEENQTTPDVNLPEQEVIEESKPIEPTQEDNQQSQRTEPLNSIEFESTAVQNGDVIKASASLPEPISGTCVFKFVRNGQEVVKSAEVSNGKTCGVTMSKAQDFNNDSEDWEFYAWFEGEANSRGASEVAGFTVR